jgi:hypothetical protein
MRCYLCKATSKDIDKMVQQPIIEENLRVRNFIVACLDTDDGMLLASILQTRFTKMIVQPCARDITSNFQS